MYVIQNLLTVIAKKKLYSHLLGSKEAGLTPDRLNEILVQQLDELIDEFAQFRKQSQHDDCSDVMSEQKAFEMATRAYAAIERVSGVGSPYSRRAEAVRGYEQLKAARLVGIVSSLRADLTAGYLRTIEELIHGEMFGDFLDMAQHLLDSGYKDPAAVVAGSALESHLRQLAKRVGLSLEASGRKGIQPKKADQINTELAKAGAYSVLDQKNVTAWMGLRNKAAHGRYSEYQKEQVALMVNAIRDFITRHPA